MCFNTLGKIDLEQIFERGGGKALDIVRRDFKILVNLIVFKEEIE
jgi:hypothetical protein